MGMHPIRKQIVKSLMYADCLSFSQLKPKEIEANIFIYHLKQLINEGLIEKNSAGNYGLTLDGKIFVDRLSTLNYSTRMQPKIITVVVCRNQQGQLLFYRRTRQPFVGWNAFPFGKLHLGESVLDSAKREMSEKAGLEMELKHVADVYLKTVQEDKIIAHSLCHVCVGSNPTGELKKIDQVSTNDDCFWDSEEVIHQSKFIPGFDQIYQLAQEAQTFQFRELVCESDWTS